MGDRPASRSPLHFRLFALGVLLFLSLPGVAQRQENSPVFRSYRPPDELPFLSTTDPIYQIWQAFLAARKAEAGEVLAHHEIGVRYLRGAGVEADTGRAAAWIRRAAEQGHPPAQHDLAVLLFQGWGLPWDPFEAYRLFRRLAEAGRAESQFAAGQFLMENLVVREDLLKAREWFSRAAAQKHAGAAEALADVNRLIARQAGARAADSTGEGHPGESQKVLRPVFLELAADSGVPQSPGGALQEVLRSGDSEMRSALGFPRTADGLPETDSASFAALVRAADAGSPEALALLGRVYERGMGVWRDEVAACAYYLRAVRMDSPRGRERLWRLLESPDLAPELRSRVGRGDPVARFVWAVLLGLGYEGSLARQQALITPAQALGMLRAASDSGYVPAMIELGLCAYVGRWVGQDRGQALLEWRRAASAGSVEAEVRLAVDSLRSEVGPDGPGRALRVLRRAGTEGSVLADVAIGFAYEKGLGVPPSPSEAARWYRSAARRGSQDAYRALRRMHDEARPPGEEFAIPEF